jgi:hypothetical protein
MTLAVLMAALDTYRNLGIQEENKTSNEFLTIVSQGGANPETHCPLFLRGQKPA